MISSKISTLNAYPIIIYHNATFNHPDKATAAPSIPLAPTTVPNKENKVLDKKKLKKSVLLELTVPWKNRGQVSLLTLKKGTLVP
jgi:hypothetical protein